MRVQDDEALLKVIAHELGNRITPAVFKLSYLQRDRALPRETRTALRGVERMLTSVAADLVNLSDLHAAITGRLEVRRMQLDVGALIADAEALYRERFTTRDIDLTVSCSADGFFGDAQRLAQVLHNLLSNAVKYTPTGGSVALTCTAADDLVLEVENTGEPIAQEHAEAIFQPFHRPGLGQYVASGVGLGLAVARGIVAAHGGSIEAGEGPRWGGPCFRVQIPDASAQVRRSVSATATAPSSAAKGSPGAFSAAGAGSAASTGSLSGSKS